MVDVGVVVGADEVRISIVGDLCQGTNFGWQMSTTEESSYTVPPGSDPGSQNAYFSTRARIRFILK